MAIPMLLIALLVGWMIVIHRVIPAPPLVISEETTRITGPLTAEGHIDFFRALELRISSPELATDDNGYRVFVRLFGDFGGSYHGISDEDREFYRLQLYEKLGLDPDVPPTLLIPEDAGIVVMNYYRAKGEDRSWRSVIRDRNYWTLEDYPMLADWVNEIDAPLDAIAEAIRKPVFLFPLLQDRASVESGIPQNQFAIVLPELQFRHVVRIFQERAFYRIGQGNIDGAIDDKLTVIRLGRHMAHGGAILRYLVSIGIEGMGRAIPVGAHPEHPLTEQQIRRILDGLDTLPPLPPFTDAIEWERYWALSFVQNSYIAIAQGNMSLSKGFEMLSDPGHHHDANWLAIGASPHSFDWNTIYRRINEVYDAAQQPSPRTEYAAILNEIEAASGWQAFRLLIPGSKSTLLANMIIPLVAPEVDAFEAAIHRAKCNENLQRLALAILLYELEHGTMPGADWATQIDVPAQYFSCPRNPSPEGYTTYALVQYGDTTSGHAIGSLLLIELAEPVPFAEAVITVDEVFTLPGSRTVEIVERECCGRTFMTERVTVVESQLTAHTGGANTAHRSGAVRFLSQTVSEEELLRLLGRAGEQGNEKQGNEE